jgi:type IV secretory pathway TrbD component
MRLLSNGRIQQIYLKGFGVGLWFLNQAMLRFMKQINASMKLVEGW